MDEAVARVERAIAEIAAGRMIILTDDEDRENEGDLCMAAEKVTAEAVNFMAKEGRGLICLTLTPQRCEQLALDMMVDNNRSPFGTAFTVSIEARQGVTTGISAADRATTVKVAVAPNARPDDLVRPGHVFPLRAQPGGVLVRTGQTEGSVDLARLAGLEPAGVICEVMKDDGTMARMPDLEKFAARHGLQILTVADLINYRLQRERLVLRMAEGNFVPGFDGVTGDFSAHVYRSSVGGAEFLALVRGKWGPDEDVLVRVHSACIGDVFNAPTCDCGVLLRESVRMIQQEGKGVVLYVLPHRLRVAEQFEGHVLHRDRPAGTDEKPEVPQPLRGFGLGAQVLMDLGLRRIRLLSNNPKNIKGLSGYGIQIVDRVPVLVPETRHNVTFLDKKRMRGERDPARSRTGAEKSGG